MIVSDLATPECKFLIDDAAPLFFRIPPEPELLVVYVFPKDVSKK